MTLSKKEYHTGLILNLLREHSALSRIQIQAKTGIRLATITAIIGELIEGKILKEGSRLNSKRGRQQTLLEIESSAGYGIGLEFTPLCVYGCLLDLKGNILLKLKKEALVKGQFSTRDAEKVFNKIIKQSGIKKSKLVGIGISLPGLVDTKTGTWISSTLIEDIQNIKLKDKLEEIFQISVYIEDRPRAKLLGYMNISNSTEDNVLMVDLSSGIGAAVLNEGNLYRGRTDSGVELGHIHILDNGPMCKCGNRGCLEAISSLEAIGKSASDAIRDGVMSVIDGDVGRISGEDVLTAALKGDKLAVEVVDEAAKYLGIAAAHAVNMFNPGLVVFSYEIPEMKQLMIESAQNMIKKYSLKTSWEKIKFQDSCGEEFLGSIGSAMISVEKFFSFPEINIV